MPSATSPDPPAEPSGPALDDEASTAHARHESGHFAIVTSILSLCVALFGTGFTVLHASAEDQSKLRGELTETMRLLSAVKPGQATSNERMAILAQIAQIIERVHNVPSTYYRRLGQGLATQLRYSEAVAALRRSIMLAASEHSPVDVVAGHRALADVYFRIGDAASARKELVAAVQVTSSDRLSSAALKEMAPLTLAQLSSEQTRLGDCHSALSALAKALHAVRAVPRPIEGEILGGVNTAAKNSVQACSASRAKASVP